VTGAGSAAAPGRTEPRAGSRTGTETVEASGGGGGAELAVAGVAEAGDDERVVVEVFVDGGRVDRQVEAGLLQQGDTFGVGQHAHDDDRARRVALKQQLARVRERPTRRQHRVEDDALA